MANTASDLSNIPPDDQDLISRMPGVRNFRKASVAGAEIMNIYRGREKMDASTLNLLCAKAQSDAEQSGDADWCIFSSWLGPLVSKKVTEGNSYGTIQGHILAAAPDGEGSTLLARTRWMIPLCSFKQPYHWILAWVDFAESKVRIFDSIPELGSSSWAEPLLLQIIDRINLTIGQPLNRWDTGRWKREIISPMQMERQFDGWSCGLFVLMAVWALSKRCTIESEVGHSKLAATRRKAVELILDIPISHRTSGSDRKFAEGEVEVTKELHSVPVEARPSSNISDVKTIATATSQLATGIPKSEAIAEAEHRNEHEKRENEGDPMMIDTDADDVQLLRKTGAKVARGGAGKQKECVKVEDKASEGGDDGKRRESSGRHMLPKKRTQAAKSDSEDDEHSADEKKFARLSLIRSVPRRRLSEEERIQHLKDDTWVKKSDASSVLCRGCNHTLRLSARKERTYELRNWEAHKAACSHITGVKIVRVRKAEGPKIDPISRPQGQRSIQAFFGASIEPSAPQAATTSQGVRAAATTVVKGDPKIRYEIHAVKMETPITSFLSTLNGSAASGRPVLKVEKQTVPNPTASCCHLAGQDYAPYIELTNTRDFGGISPAFVARASRQLFPYKSFPSLKNANNMDVLKISPVLDTKVPSNGNLEVERPKWTSSEVDKIDAVLQFWARWKVNYAEGYVKSTSCDETTQNSDGICDRCREVALDESFKHAVRKKQHEASLPIEERRERLAARQKYARTDGLRIIAQDALRAKLKDPVLFDLSEMLKTGNPEDCFLRLFKAAKEGYLADHQNFLNICDVFEDRLARDNSGNENAKFGMRYSPAYIQFAIVLRGHGHNSNRQYEILQAALLGPSSRQLKTLSKRSADSFSNPALIYENVARVKRYVDSVGYKGPILAAGDNTKVRQRLTFSTDFGAHVLGSIYDLSDVEVENAADIDRIVERATKEKAFASQARAIIAKVPLPGSPPIVVAILPTKGNEDAAKIHVQHLQFQIMAAQLELPLVALAADGAASELAAQSVMDQVQSELPPLVYDYPLYGVHLRAPVFRTTGPLISLTDPPHARKTARNQPQYGTHTASMGIGFLVNQSLVDVYNLKPIRSGLVYRDVHNVDKQDDGAARRTFHHEALSAMTMEGEDGSKLIRAGFEGFFSYSFVLGSLFEAWMNPDMDVEKRVLAALRARFWLHHWRQHVLNLCKAFPDLFSIAQSFISPASFHIFNRLCDTLVLLALAYSMHYPSTPFCIWLFATDFVEHFFGIARQILPNFTYAEFIKMTHHIMVRQRILDSGLIKFKKDRTTAVDYIFNDDLDMRRNAPSATPIPCSNITPAVLNRLIPIAHNEAARICRDILCIPVSSVTEKRPLLLVPLGATKRGKKTPQAVLVDGDDAADPFEVDLDEELEDSDGEDEPDMLDTVGSGDETTLGEAATVASAETARYLALCKDLDAVVEEAGLEGEDIGLPPSYPVQAEAPLTNGSTNDLAPSGTLVASSKLVDATGKISVPAVLSERLAVQSGTVVKSERVARVSKKYTALEKVLNEERKFRPDEASHRLRIAQEINPDLKKQEAKKTRQYRWQSAAKKLIQDLRLDIRVIPNLSEKNVGSEPSTILQRHSFLIMRTDKRVYIGEVLDIYKKGQNSKYGSLDQSTTLSGLSWLSLRVYLPLEVAKHSSASDSEDVTSSDNDLDDGHGSASSDLPDFSCAINILGGKMKYHLHTHAPVANVIYHLGKDALQGGFGKKQLTPLAASRWKALGQPRAQSIMSKVQPALKIRIPATVNK